MKSSLKRTAEKVYSRLLTLNNPFYFYGIPKKDYTIEGQMVRLKKLDIVVDSTDKDGVLKGYPYALQISQILHGKYTVENQNLFLCFDDLKFQINSAEELFIIYEVFITKTYNYPCLRDTVFIDVGMNAAVTTLFYSKDPLVKRIYSYELFKPTFLLGQKNLTLNEKYAHKVKAFNYGLSNRAFEQAIDYSLSRKGRMGLNGLPHDELFQDIKKENVTVRDINEVFAEILADSGSMDIVVKMDCEGEEFNLINSLSHSGLLGKLTVLIIEWHYHQPTEIENHLKAFDFRVFSQVLPSLDSGMIYASKRIG